MRATITDIARQAGVSTATVDRVLNERPGVRAPHPRAGARRGARTVGYLGERRAVSGPGATSSRSTSSSRAAPTPSWACSPPTWRRPPAREGARGRRPRPHGRRLQPGGAGRDAARAGAREPRRRPDRARPPAGPRGDPRGRGAGPAGRSPWSPTSATCRASAMSASTTGPPAASPATCSGASCRGGPGEVALFAGSLSYRGHEEREMGFRHMLAEDFPELRDRRAARGPRRPAAQLPRGPAPARGAGRGSAASTISAPATAASRGRWRRPGGRAGWCSSATS